MIRYKFYIKVNCVPTETPIPITETPTPTPTPTPIPITETPTETPISTSNANLIFEDIGMIDIKKMKLRYTPTPTPTPTPTLESIPEIGLSNIIRDFNLIQKNDESILGLMEKYSLGFSTLQETCSNFLEDGTVTDEIVGTLNQNNFCNSTSFKLESESPYIDLVDENYWVSNGRYGRMAMKSGDTLNFMGDCIQCGSQPNTLFVKYNTFMI
jgi:hypothetical protein